ncbi:zinc-binding dehydrogenase [Nocardioides nitrophenolicus]|uniref:zinc-binding dehydrogenase n=1 Tax=Nocardioides nitrophenolicus TaxID=60489 RepID=UPI001956E89C|nr:zinc-binding dehydrogenase [Nocardioides nitrophenolicus]MBM7517497.1 NADPH:quinone reductase-like Zn-dependent oxidoreductase [Nocardioides nitrophenolicus]
MRAAYVGGSSATDPASAVEVGELPTPSVPEGWAAVEMRAGALNMHDVWMLRGVARQPDGVHVLGSDGAGVYDGREVVVYPVLPGRVTSKVVAHATLVSDLGHGLLAETAVVPVGSLVPKPAHLSMAEAACLPTAWLTAYRMLFTRAGLHAGQTVLVQGAGGGVATAAAALATAAGAEVLVTSRSAEKRERALAAGARLALAPGERVPDLVDVVVETVGPATFEHSVLSTRAGGAIVTCGASTGFVAELDLARLFAREISVHGSTMGTLEEFRALLGLVEEHRITPVVDSVVPLAEVRGQVERMLAGTAFGKLCVSIP